MVVCYLIRRTSKIKLVEIDRPTIIYLCGNNVQKMVQERLPRRILERCPSGRRRKGRPRNSWMQEVTTGLRERGIGGLEWVDREEWRKKMNLP